MRTRKEIDSEYSVLAQLYGDRVFKASMMQAEIKELHEKLTALAKEPAAPPIPEAPDPAIAKVAKALAEVPQTEKKSS